MKSKYPLLAFVSSLAPPGACSSNYLDDPMSEIDDATSMAMKSR